MNLDIFIVCFSVGREAVGGVGTDIGVGILVEALASLYIFRGINVVTGITGNSVNWKVSHFKIRKPLLMFGQTLSAMEGKNCQNYSKRRRIHLFRNDMIILNYKKEDTLIYTFRNNLITYFDGRDA